MLRLYKVLKFLFRHVVPGWLRYLLARLIARGIILFNRRRRETIVANLIPLVGVASARRMAPELLGNFLMTAVDFFCPRTNVARETRLENWNYLERAYRKDKRVIAVTAHIGHWELGISCLVEKGYDVAGVYAPYREDEVVRWILKHRSADVEWIPATRGAAMACIQAIERGKVVGMVADLPYGELGRRVTMAGTPARLPLGPWAIAVRARAVVIPAFMIREFPGRYRLEMQEPIYPGEGSFRKQLEGMQDVYKSQLEFYLKKYPQQWGILTPFWDKGAQSF
ncbi:MAG TPA: lysophospholipid acyltransferase family protein [Elusimicrobiota bacterium]|nr:lysophospholipid acyltransferase family protein [Elusimicrobiota bacterium]